MTISLNLLTMGRPSVVVKTLANNLARAGREIDEIVWCDNGSPADEHELIRAALAGHQPQYRFALVQVRHDTNLGVAPGYNRCAALSTSDLVCITGCDRMMPDNWLTDMALVLEHAPTLAAVSVYSGGVNATPDRIRGAPYQFRHLELIPAMPFEARLFRRSLLKSAGYLREDFGLYGWEDVEWSHRVLRVCRERGHGCVAITNMKVENLGNQGHAEPEEYQKFKSEQARDPVKVELSKKCERDGFKFYSPY